jgi:hypothetical protein
MLAFATTGIDKDNVDSAACKGWSSRQVFQVLVVELQAGICIQVVEFQTGFLSNFVASLGDPLGNIPFIERIGWFVLQPTQIRCLQIFL